MTEKAGRCDQGAPGNLAVYYFAYLPMFFYEREFY
jgi:hypothetical protein